MVAHEPDVAVGQREGRHAVEGARRRHAITHSLAAHAEADDAEIGRESQLGALPARHQITIATLPDACVANVGPDSIATDRAACETEQGRGDQRHGAEAGGVAEQGTAVQAHQDTV